MNLRHQPKTQATGKNQITSDTKNESPWYRQSEETFEEAGGKQTSPHYTGSPRYDAAAAQRILARAGALQDELRQTLSRDQIEALAEEIGIEESFVRLALEMEKTGAFSHSGGIGKAGKTMTEPTTVSVIATSSVTSLAYGILATIFLRVAFAAGEHALISVFALILPTLLALGIGGLSPKRRLGAAAGASVGFSAIAALAAVALTIEAGNMSLPGLSFYVVMIGSGAVLGAAGAEARRQATKRVEKRLRA